MDNNYTVKMTPRSYIVYNWIHHVARKQVKIGVHGFRLGNINQPYESDRIFYNLPVPSIDISEYELIQHVQEYEGATVYLKTEDSPSKITKYQTSIAYTCYRDTDSESGTVSSRLARHVSAIYLKIDDTKLVTYWSRINGVEPYMAQNTVMITTFQIPWLLKSNESPSLMDVFSSMGYIIGNFFRVISCGALLAMPNPTKPGIYLAKNGLALCRLPNGHWVLDVKKFHHTELTWEQVKSSMPEDQFPLEYLGKTLWN